MIDRSNGYETHAAAFMSARSPQIGTSLIRDWARHFRKGSAVLELGCGHGVVSEGLIAAEVTLFAVDASPTLLAAFRRKFPGARTECSAAEASTFFGRKFEGIVAWGLIFLLEETVQRILIHKAAEALKPGGRMLFTAPRDPAEWDDAITGRPSLGLGASTYEQILRRSGLIVLPGSTDEGDNHYFSAVKPRDSG